MELLKLSSHQEITNIIQKKNLPLSFFASPHMLHTFFNNRGFDLWSVSYQENSYIIVRKIDREFGNNEIRLLFEIFPNEVIEFLMKEFDPPFIAYNELFIDPRKENQIEGVDVIVDLSKYVHLEDKNIRKHYRQAVTEYKKEWLLNCLETEQWRRRQRLRSSSDHVLKIAYEKAMRRKYTDENHKLFIKSHVPLLQSVREKLFLFLENKDVKISLPKQLMIYLSSIKKTIVGEKEDVKIFLKERFEKLLSSQQCA